MKRFAIGLMVASVSAAWAGGMESLEVFVKTVKTGHADFTQVVTAPSRQGQAARSKTSSGTFDFSRPNRFRFVYKKPFEQSIVADGQTLWLFDVDLNQVTARKQSLVLGSTPAALIASAPDLHALQADFSLAAAPDRDGLEWVLASPKAKDSQLQSIAVGLRKGELATRQAQKERVERQLSECKECEAQGAAPRTPTLGADSVGVGSGSKCQRPSGFDADPVGEDRT